MGNQVGNQVGNWVGANAPEATALKEQIQTLASSIHAAESELVGLLSELDECDGWAGLGIRSMSHWLTVRCGFTRSEADAREKLAKRRDELPKLYSEFGRGALSVGFMRSAERVATPANEDQVTRIATTATAPQAAKTFAAFRTAEKRRSDAQDRKDSEVRPPETPGAGDTEAADPVDKGLWLHTWWDEHEHLRVNGRLDTTDGAIFMTLLDQLRTKDRSAAGSNDAASGGEAPSGAPASADSARKFRFMTKPEAFSELLRLAGDALANSGTRNSWSDRFAVTVNIDLDVLLGIREGRGTLVDGTPIDAGMIRDWFSDAKIQGLLSHRGKPLYLGRTVRVATAAQKRALLVRDGGCAFPGCCRTDHLDAHHVRPWEQSGPTDIDNLVLLCRRHHRLLHRGEYEIHMEEGRPVFIPDPTGARAGPPGRRDPSDRPESLAVLKRRRHELDGESAADADPRAPHRSGETLTRYGLDVWVSSLLAAA